MVNGLRITPATQAAQHPSGFHAPFPPNTLLHRTCSQASSAAMFWHTHHTRFYCIVFVVYLLYTSLCYVHFLACIPKKSTREFQTMILRVESRPSCQFLFVILRSYYSMCWGLGKLWHIGVCFLFANDQLRSVRGEEFLDKMAIVRQHVTLFRSLSRNISRFETFVIICRIPSTLGHHCSFCRRLEGLL